MTIRFQLHTKEKKIDNILFVTRVISVGNMTRVQIVRQEKDIFVYKCYIYIYWKDKIIEKKIQLEYIQ